MKRTCGVCVLLALCVATIRAAQNPLVDAVQNGNKDAVRALLKKPTSVNTPAADGSTALHWAVQANDVETIDLLLHAGAQVNIANRYGVTPLGLAAENGNATVAEQLLKAGADPKAVTSVAGQTVLMSAARTGNAAIVKMLLARGADPNARESWLGETALMWAAAENHVSVVEALLDAGADPYVSTKIYPDYDLRPSEGATVPPQYISKGGMSALHFAARQGAREVVRLMADKQVDLEQADPDGMTALIFATLNGNFDTAALLLEKGANPNRADDYGQAVLYLAADLNRLEEEGGAIGPRGTPARTQDETSPIRLAAFAITKGAGVNAQIVKRLQRRAPFSSIDPMPEGATPLWRAARTLDVDFVQLLLSAGADPTIPAIDGRTPLMAAAGPDLGNRFPDTLEPIGTDEEAVRVIRLLLEAGVNVNAGNDRGETALHVAAGKGSEAVVKLLLEHGARLDTRDIDNRTPLDVALAIPRSGGEFDLGKVVPKMRERTAAFLRELMIAKGLSIEPYVRPTRQAPSSP